MSRDARMTSGVPYFASKPVHGRRSSFASPEWTSTTTSAQSKICVVSVWAIRSVIVPDARPGNWRFRFFPSIGET
jgi:hypothetical protein